MTTRFGRIYAKIITIVFAYLMFVRILIADSHHIQISDAYILSSLPESNSTAAFVTITNNSDKPLALVSVSNSLGAISEIHTHIHKNGTTQMAKVDKLEIPAKSEAKLEPHKDHIMLIGLQKPLTTAQSVDLVLKFSDESVITIKDVSIKEREKHHKPNPNQAHKILRDGKVELMFQNKPFYIKVMPKDMRPLQPIIFRISNLNLPQPSLKARIYGVNMDMGTIFVEFKKSQGDTYEAKVFLSACSLDTMTYRLEFEDMLSGIAFDFDVRK